MTAMRPWKMVENRTSIDVRTSMHGPSPPGISGGDGPCIHLRTSINLRYFLYFCCYAIYQYFSKRWSSDLVQFTKN